MFNVLITDPLPDEGLALLRAAPDVRLDYVPLRGPELLAAIGAYDALIVRSGTAVDDALIEAGARLKIIGRAGVAADNINVAAATARGIMVMTTPEPVSVSAAEHTLALLLALALAMAVAYAGTDEAHQLLTPGRNPSLADVAIDAAGAAEGVWVMGRLGRR